MTMTFAVYTETPAPSCSVRLSGSSTPQGTVTRKHRSLAEEAAPGHAAGSSFPGRPAPRGAHSGQTRPRPPAGALHVSACPRKRPEGSGGQQSANGEHLVRGVGRQLVQVCGEPVRAHHVGRLRVVEHKAGRYRRLQECRLLDGHAQPDAALAALAPRLRRCGPLTPRPGRKAGAAACRVSADRLVQAWRACSEWCRRSVNSSLLSGRQPASTNTPSYASPLPARTATAGRGAASAMLAFDTSLLGCNVW